jgi:hypothetical protein
MEDINLGMIRILRLQAGSLPAPLRTLLNLFLCPSPPEGESRWEGPAQTHLHRLVRTSKSQGEPKIVLEFAVILTLQIYGTALASHRVRTNP